LLSKLIEREEESSHPTGQMRRRRRSQMLDARSQELSDGQTIGRG